jgi:hypothetical protein
MSEDSINKYRAAIHVLQSGRDVLVESLANEILDQEENLMEGGYLFNEFLETQGTRLHFLGLLVSQLEYAADALEVATVPPPPPPKRRARSKPKAKAKKAEPQAAEQQAAEKESSDEL